MGSDIVEGKMTLLVVNALARASEEDHNRLLTILKEEGEEHVSEAIGDHGKIRLHRVCLAGGSGRC